MDLLLFRGRKRANSGATPPTKVSRVHFPLLDLPMELICAIIDRVESVSDFCALSLACWFLYRLCVQDPQRVAAARRRFFRTGRERNPHGYVWCSRLRDGTHHGKYTQVVVRNPHPYVESQRCYHFGRLHGKSIKFYPNGRVLRSTDYTYGVIDGFDCVFASDGTKSLERFSVAGDMRREAQFDALGSLTQVSHWLRGKRHGPYELHTAGRIHFGQHEHDKPVGEWRVLTTHGILVETRTHIDGRLLVLRQFTQKGLSLVRYFTYDQNTDECSTYEQVFDRDFLSREVYQSKKRAQKITVLYGASCELYDHDAANHCPNGMISIRIVVPTLRGKTHGVVIRRGCWKATDVICSSTISQGQRNGPTVIQTMQGKHVLREENYVNGRRWGRFVRRVLTIDGRLIMVRLRHFVDGELHGTESRWCPVDGRLLGTKRWFRGVLCSVSGECTH